MRLAMVALACGCGRVGFVEHVPMSDSATPDAAPLRPCGAATTAPDPVTIRGATFEFTSFTNDRGPIDTVTVEAFDDTGTLRGSTVSDAQGLYVLSIETAGVAPQLRLRYSKAGFFTSTVHLDAPLDSDLLLGDPAVLNASDGPLWSDGAMDAVYSSAGVTRQQAAGTLNITVIDCLAQPLGGVAVSLDQTAEVAAYLNSDGKPDASLTKTTTPMAFVVAYNATAAPTKITATAAGRAFVPATYPVLAGTEVTLARVRPTE